MLDPVVLPFVVATAGAVVAFVVKGDRSVRRFRAAWLEAVRVCGLRKVQTSGWIGFVATARSDSFAVRVETVGQRAAGMALQVRVHTVTDRIGLLMPELVAPGQTVTSSEDIVVGEPRLDDRMILSGEPLAVRALLDRGHARPPAHPRRRLDRSGPAGSARPLAAHVRRHALDRGRVRAARGHARHAAAARGEAGRGASGRRGGGGRGGGRPAAVRADRQPERADGGAPAPSRDAGRAAHGALGPGRARAADRGADAADRRARGAARDRSQPGQRGRRRGPRDRGSRGPSPRGRRGARARARGPDGTVRARPAPAWTRWRRAGGAGADPPRARRRERHLRRPGRERSGAVGHRAGRAPAPPGARARVDGGPRLRGARARPRGNGGLGARAARGRARATPRSDASCASRSRPSSRG